jgi:predicted alpha/beta-hydrolase family hydrolase
VTTTVLELDTPHGVARAHVDDVARPHALLVVSHGAGGGVDAPDLLATRDVAVELGIGVARVEQPYRVAGRRAPAPAKQLDANWVAIVEQLRERAPAGTPVLVGGRSMGARVACRTAADVDAAGVLCLAFPLQPRPRAGGTQAPSRLPELDAVLVPTLVVQGRTDAFGMPRGRRGRRTVVRVRGDHSLRQDVPAVADAVRTWLESFT